LPVRRVGGADQPLDRVEQVAVILERLFHPVLELEGQPLERLDRVLEIGQ
jgi:hypothetical protein